MATTPEDVQVNFRRSRTRVRSLGFDKQKIFTRVHNFYRNDKDARDRDRSIRLQRYAKYRMWVEGNDFPWEDASDLPMSDMLEKSLRMQDTIHNAVMQARPPITANALNKADKEKEKTNETLIDYQFFEESPGETIIGDMADAFVNDGVITVFVPWIKEMREISDVLVFDPIPEDVLPLQYFSSIIAQKFKVNSNSIQFSASGWNANIVYAPREGEEQKVEIKFYTRDNGEVEMVTREKAEVFNGPRPMVMDYDDVLHPARCENLQIPSPSNPGGAGHVILIDHPSIDEIKRLAKSKFYDLIDDDTLESLENLATNDDDDEEEDERDDMAGVNDEPKKDSHAKSHTKLTRLLCFDCFDIDGDGIDEDVIWWVLLEPKVVVKAIYMTEMYPEKPPRRPFGEASFLPVRGRRVGISMLELLEGLHDAMKAILDQSVDSGTISNLPFFFYSQRQGIRPEIISLQPGEGYPVPDAQRDINFPKIGNPQAQGFAINMVTMLQQMEERASMIGDLQLGRVPAGKSSALRTVGGMALLAGQGEARPERIMRRFFICLSEVWKRIHALNQYYLPKDKEFRITGPVPDREEPYQKITSTESISGRFDFTFKANVLNTSKQQLTETLSVLMQTYISEIALQLGIIDADGIYRLLKDFGKALGHDAEDYLKPPSPDSMLPKILAEEAIQAILNNTMPEGVPMEAGGAQEHLQKLQAFFQSDDFGRLSDTTLQIFQEYMQQVIQRVQDQIKQQQLIEAAQQFGQGGTQNAGGRPAENAPPNANENPQVSSGNELIDESLPGAGGGGQQ